MEEEEDEEEVAEEEEDEVGGEEAPVEDHPPDHGARGVDGQVPPDLLGVPLEAGLEVEHLLPSPSQPSSSRTNLGKPSTHRFQSQVVQLEAMLVSVDRSTVTGPPVTGQTGEPHSLVALVCTTRRGVSQRRHLVLVWQLALLEELLLAWLAPWPHIVSTTGNWDWEVLHCLVSIATGTMNSRG